MEWFWTIVEWLPWILGVVAVGSFGTFLFVMIRAQRACRRRLPPVQVAGASEDGLFLYRGEGDIFELRWDDIEEIETFKVDLYIHDEILVGFVARGGAYFQVSEEDSGFAEAMEQMRIAFPSIPENWFDTVMRPAFATNHCVLWKRHAHDPIAVATD